MSINELIEELQKIDPMYRDGTIRVWVDGMPLGQKRRNIEVIDEDEGEFFLVTD